jgi:release factor glutamine methyltransferase
VTIGASLDDAARRLREAGLDNARLDARLLLAHALNQSASEVIDPAREFGGAQRERFAAMLRRRLAREPLAYIVGHKEFWSLDFEVGPGALIPRPESETIIEELIRLVPDRNTPLELLDLGTGTGCLLLAALTEYPRARGTGIDASEEALIWARRNVAKLGLETRCSLSLADWGRIIEGSYDAILANPPYIRSGDIAALAPEVSRYEPVPALDGGPDGLAAYREVAARIAPLLKPDGVLLGEIGEGQGTQVASILAAAGIGTAKIVEDLARIPRCVVGRPRNR